MRAPASPQFRFLLRDSALFIAMLVLCLLSGGLSASGVMVEPSSDWMVRVPIPEFVAKMDATQRAYGRVPSPPAVNVRSFKLEIAERIPTFFTLSFPLFWALMLAVGRTPRLWLVLAIGSALLAVLAQLSRLLYTAYSIETTLRLATEGAAATIALSQNENPLALRIRNTVRRIGRVMS